MLNWLRPTYQWGCFLQGCAHTEWKARTIINHMVDMGKWHHGIIISFFSFFSCNDKCFSKKVNNLFTVTCNINSRGWQIKHTLQNLGVQPLQYSGPIIPQPLWGHSSMVSSFPWQFKSDNHTLSAPWLVAVHSLFENLCFTGGPWRSCRHITSADRYVKSCTAQIVPHVPLYLTCTWPACDVSIPNKRTSTSAVKVRSMTENFLR